MKMLNECRFRYMRFLSEKFPKLYRKKAKSIAASLESYDKSFESQKFRVDMLKSNGYLILNENEFNLNEADIEAIKNRLSNLNCFYPHNRSIPNFDPKMPPHNIHVAMYEKSDLVKIKEVMDVANNPKVLEFVAGYIGCKPTISNINLWWSYPANQAKEAQFFHRDVDDYKFIKLFVYLTDVDENSGPHVYIPGSVNSNKLLKIRRYSDEEVSKCFLEKQVYIAKKGTAILEDTYGIHKGQVPTSSKRLLLQIQYGLGPIGIEAYSPVSVKEYDCSIYDSYINRGSTSLIGCLLSD